MWMATIDQLVVPYYISSLKINFSVDDTLMWLIYIAYVRFWGNALQLKKSEGKFTWVFYQTAIPLIIGYIIFENIAVNIPTKTFGTILYIFIRIYLGCFGFYVTILSLKKRESHYYNYLAGGSIAIITSSLVSTYVYFVLGSTFLNINAFGWLMVGYFADVIFFSAAIGYRLKEESTERVLALQKIIDQQNEIKKLEIEKIQAEYDTREQERNRISAELHDDLGGRLSTIRLMTEMIKNPQFGFNSTHLNNISQKIKELIQNMNEIVWSLNNTNDSIAGTIVYIRQYAGSFFEDTRIHLTFNQPDVVPYIDIDGSSRRHIFLIVKEALHNIVKHSGADKVQINISIDDNFIISIADNGKGISNTEKKNSSNGLHNMQQRIDTLKGSFQISQQKGTTLIFSIPCSSLYNKSVNQTMFKED